MSDFCCENTFVAASRRMVNVTVLIPYLDIEVYIAVSNDLNILVFSDTMIEGFALKLF